MDKLRLTVIGAGVMGKCDLDILLEGKGCAAAAVADPSPQAEKLAGGAGVRYYAGHEKMQNSYYISGTRGGLALPSLQLWWRGEGLGWNNPLNHERHPYRVAEPWAAQMQHFAAVIRREAQPLVNGREGVAMLAATLAIHESARTGEPGKLDAFSRRA